MRLRLPVNPVRRKCFERLPGFATDIKGLLKYKNSIHPSLSIFIHSFNHIYIQTPTNYLPNLLVPLIFKSRCTPLPSSSPPSASPPPPQPPSSPPARSLASPLSTATLAAAAPVPSATKLDPEISIRDATPSPTRARRA
jgi:hypothetical protein